MDIFMAVKANNIKRLRHFLDVEKINPNITNYPYGFSPLHLAASFNNPESAEILLVAGADVNMRSAWGWLSPLHLAYKKGSVAVATILLQRGALRLITNKYGQTPGELALAAGLTMECARIDQVARQIMEDRRKATARSASSGAKVAKGLSKRAITAPKLTVQPSVIVIQEEEGA